MFGSNACDVFRINSYLAWPLFPDSVLCKTKHGIDHGHGSSSIKPGLTGVIFIRNNDLFASSALL